MCSFMNRVGVCVSFTFLRLMFSMRTEFFVTNQPWSLPPFVFQLCSSTVSDYSCSWSWTYPAKLFLPMSIKMKNLNQVSFAAGFSRVHLSVHVVHGMGGRHHLFSCS